MQGAAIAAGACCGSGGNLTFLSVWDAGAFSIFSSKPPAVKGAFDATAHDAPAGGEVRPEVRAVSVDHVGLAVLGAKRSEMFSCRRMRL